MRMFSVCCLAFIGLTCGVATAAEAGGDSAALAAEVAAKGWIVYCAPCENGTWDLFLMRPDGSQRRNITNTPEFEEAAPRFSPDGKQMLFRRMEKGATIDHDRWGFQGVPMVAGADGSNPVALAEDGQLPWASWSPDGKQVSCLDKKGIEIYDIGTRQVVKKMPRESVYQQLFWSPDGRYFCGVANHQGAQWTVVRIDVASGAVNAVRTYQNCTPDWCPDSQRVILSSRPKDQKVNDGYGYTQLWIAAGDGGEQRFVYGEEGAHIYGGGMSPDGVYVLFTKSRGDGGGSEREGGGAMTLMRYADTPAIHGESAEMRAAYPNTVDGPELDLGQGWEPHWTFTEIESAAGK